jgi:tRNA(fMet)-specific endonuclease VapC
VRVQLDTNAYVAFKGGDPDTVDVIRLADRLALSTVVVGELLAGFALGSRASENRRELASFLESPRVEILPVGRDTATFYAAVYAQLRAKGRPLPTNDMWVAAGALEHGSVLLTHDKHFASVEGLIVVRRPEDLLP